MISSDQFVQHLSALPREQVVAHAVVFGLAIGVLAIRFAAVLLRFLVKLAFGLAVVWLVAHALQHAQSDANGPTQAVEGSRGLPSPVAAESARN